MKIAIVCLQLETPGGTQRQALSLARALTRKGEEVAVFTTGINREYFRELIAGLDVRVIEPPSPFSEVGRSRGGIFDIILQKARRDRLYNATAKKIAESMEADFAVLNSHDYDSYKVGYFYKKYKNPGVRHVWMMNEIPFSYLPKDSLFLEFMRRIYSVFGRFLEWRFFKSIDCVTTLNSFDAAWAKKNISSPVMIVESGCDFEKFYAPVKKINAARPARLLAVGIFAPHRRFEDVIEAVAILVAKGISLHALILGTGGDIESAYAKFLADLVKKLKLQNFVKTELRHLSDSELKEFYRESDIFVFPTYIGRPRYGYGWGLAAFEAMSAGLPVVICETTASVRVLHDGENVLTVKPMSPREIAAKIRSLIERPGFYEKIARNGQDFVKNNVTWDQYAEKMMKAFSWAKR